MSNNDKQKPNDKQNKGTAKPDTDQKKGDPKAMPKVPDGMGSSGQAGSVQRGGNKQLHQKDSGGEGLPKQEMHSGPRRANHDTEDVADTRLSATENASNGLRGNDQPGIHDPVSNRDSRRPQIPPLSRH